MNNLFLIGLGGFVGAALRYYVSGFFQNLSKSSSFPYGTLSVNLLGCFIIGLLSQLAESRGFFSSETRAFVFMGLLGSFTTFSTFGLESLNLIMSGRGLLSLSNIVLHLVLGLGVILLGRVFGLYIWR